MVFIEMSILGKLFVEIILKTKKGIAMKRYLKEIVLFILFFIEAFITFLSFRDNWGESISSTLLFAGIVILYNDFQSIIDRLDSEHSEMRKQSKKEHNEIKGCIELYKDIKELSYITMYENDYINTQNGKDNDVEIWIISNDVAENDSIIDKMYNNILAGVKYYYIIPSDDTCVKDLKLTVKKIQSKDKKGALTSTIKYIQDDLFDLLPSNYVDFVFYCNPYSTDYKTNMKVFYSFQKSTSGVFYKPADLSETEIHNYFSVMNEWKTRNWVSL